MTIYVLDANVAAKWFLPANLETHAKEARNVLQDYVSGTIRLVVPDLFWPELGNVLWKAVRHGRITTRLAHDSIEDLERRAIATQPTARILANAFRIATAFDRTVYDAIYVALAVLLGAQLLTADERLANVLASRFPVRWLGVYTSIR